MKATVTYDPANNGRVSTVTVEMTGKEMGGFLVATNATVVGGDVVKALPAEVMEIRRAIIAAMK